MHCYKMQSECFQRYREIERSKRELKKYLQTDRQTGWQTEWNEHGENQRLRNRIENGQGVEL